MKKTSTFKTIKRLLKYVTSEYKGQLAIVLVSIIISALVGVLGVQFIKYLIDDFITPLLGSESPDLTSLLNVILIMGVIYLIGVISTYIYNISYSNTISQAKDAQQSAVNANFKHILHEKQIKCPFASPAFLTGMS